VGFRSSKKYGITLEMAQENLELWVEASKQLTTHQHYKLGSRELTMADLGDVMDMIEYWEGKVAALDTSRRRVRRGVLRDV